MGEKEKGNRPFNHFWMIKLASVVFETLPETFKLDELLADIHNRRDFVLRWAFCEGVESTFLPVSISHKHTQILRETQACIKTETKIAQVLGLLRPDGTAKKSQGTKCCMS